MTWSAMEAVRELTRIRAMTYGFHRQGQSAEFPEKRKIALRPLDVSPYLPSLVSRTGSYALWKVLCVRAAARFVFAYRRDGEAGVALIGHLTQSVIGGFSIADRLAIRGDTMVIIGNRGGSETFPYGYFKAWTLNTNTGRFDRV